MGRIGKCSFEFDQEAVDRDGEADQPLAAATGIEVCTGMQDEGFAGVGGFTATEDRRQPLIGFNPAPCTAAGSLNGWNWQGLTEVSLGQLGTEAVPDPGRDCLRRAESRHIGVLTADRQRL